jgi:hypothetical protein
MGSENKKKRRQFSMTHRTKRGVFVLLLVSAFSLAAAIVMMT